MKRKNQVSEWLNLEYHHCLLMAKLYKDNDAELSDHYKSQALRVKSLYSLCADNLIDWRVKQLKMERGIP